MGHVKTSGTKILLAFQLTFDLIIILGNMKEKSALFHYHISCLCLFDKW